MAPHDIQTAPDGGRRHGALRIRSLPDRNTTGTAAAKDIAEAMRDTLARQGSARMVFAAAPSQAETLAMLAQAPGIDWPRVTAFHMDEYIGLPSGAPQRFASWLGAYLFDRVPFGAAHPLVPEPDPQEQAARYAAQLNEGPIDIVVLGVGVNGHLAFNDPPVADFKDPLDVKLVELDAECRQQQVDDGCFARMSDVPTRALTLTIPRLLRSKQMFCVVPGRAKRAAITAMLHGPVATTCPASILREQSHCTLYLDAESDPDA